MSGALSGGQALGGAAIPIFAGYYPAEGSRAMTAMYDWRIKRQYNEDMAFAQAKGQMQTIQSLYVDNSQVEFPVTIYVWGTGQRIIIPAGACAVMPVYLGEGARYSIAGVLTTGEVVGTGLNDNVTSLVWLNIPCQSPSIWFVTGGASYSFISNVVTGSGVPDGGSAGLFSTLPTDCRVVIESVRIACNFATAPTASGALRVTIQDLPNGVIDDRLPFTAGQNCAVVQYSDLNFMQRTLGGNPLVAVYNFPTGAAGLQLAINTKYTLIPQIIGG